MISALVVVSVITRVGHWRPAAIFHIPQIADNHIAARAIVDTGSAEAETAIEVDSVYVVVTLLPSSRYARWGIEESREIGDVPSVAAGARSPTEHGTANLPVFGIDPVDASASREALRLRFRGRSDGENDERQGAEEDIGFEIHDGDSVDGWFVGFVKQIGFNLDLDSAVPSPTQLGVFSENVFPWRRL